MFYRSCLTVGKDGAVVAGHDFFEDGADDILVDHALVCFRTKHLIKMVALLTVEDSWTRLEEEAMTEEEEMGGGSIAHRSAGILDLMSIR